MMSAEPISAEIKRHVAEKVSRLREEKGLTPKLVALLIGLDPISRTYVQLKRADCAQVGIVSEVIDLSSVHPPEAGSQAVATIQRLNKDPAVNAIIPQMPFDGRVAEELVFSALSPDKDVDGLTPLRLGKLMRKEYSFETSLLPCTPKGIVALLQYYGVKIEGAEVAIIGRSTLVGEPLRKMLQDLNATATNYHTFSKKLKEGLLGADIIVAAAGRPPELYGSSGFRLTGEMVKEGSAVVSVGSRKDEKNGKTLFDVDLASLKGRCAFLTPNIGGVGAMTRAMLVQNTLVATNLQVQKDRSM